MQEANQEFSLKKLFVPLTTFKVIHWIVVIGLIVFFNTLFNGFVWDDISQIVENTSVHSISNIGSFFFGTHDIAGNLVKIQGVYYRPLMATIYAALYSLFGPNPFFFHLFSVILHISITFLIFYIFRNFFKNTTAFFLSMIFLIHPLNSEVVNYVGAYNDLLYFFFGIASLILLQARLTQWKKLLLISLFLFLSLLSKESGFLFIPVLIIYSFLYRKELIYKIILISLFTAGLYILLRTNFYAITPLNQVLGFSLFLHMSLPQHLINIPKIFYYYISNFLLPHNQAIAQHWAVKSLTISDFFLPLAILLVFMGFNIYLFFKFYMSGKKDKIKSVFFFSVWFWFGICLYLQLLPLDMTVADRWFYFSMIGLLGLCGISLEAVYRKGIPAKCLFLYATIVYIIFLAGKTIIRNGNWHDEYTLYVHDLKNGNQSFDLENQLGIVFFKEGRMNDAKNHFEKSIALWKCSQAVGNLGYLYELQEETKNAESYFLTALGCNSDYKSYGNLIVLLYNQGELGKSRYYINKGLQVYPNSAPLYYVLGLIEYKQGSKEKSLRDIKISYELDNNLQTAETLQQIENNQPINNKLIP